MTKSQTLQAIEKVKLSHIEQMQKIELMLRGVSVENPTTVSKMKCEFGEWLYGENSAFIANILGAQFYEQLDREHEAWHIEYAKIYTLLFQKKQEGFFTKVFFSNKPDILAIDKAKTYYMELESTTKQLLKILEKSTRRISAINASKFL